MFLYGFLYLSTFCRNDCRFCWYRRSNPACRRYRKSEAEVLEAAGRLADSGVHLLDLTLSEDPRLRTAEGFAGLARLTARVKEATGLPLMLSPGVVPAGLLRALKRAGADWYACYQETAQPRPFPPPAPGAELTTRGCGPSGRPGSAGLLLEEGILCGVGEGPRDLARSVRAMGRLGAEQVRAMSFVPRQGIPLAARHPRATRERELTAIAALRLAFPDRLIPASLDVDGLAGLAAAPRGRGQRGDLAHPAGPGAGRGGPERAGHRGGPPDGGGGAGGAGALRPGARIARGVPAVAGPAKQARCRRRGAGGPVRLAASWAADCRAWRRPTWPARRAGRCGCWTAGRRCRPKGWPTPSCRATPPTLRCLDRELRGVDLVLPALEDTPVLETLARWAGWSEVPLAFDLSAYAVSSSKRLSNRLFRAAGPGDASGVAGVRASGAGQARRAERQPRGAGVPRTRRRWRSWLARACATRRPGSCRSTWRDPPIRSRFWAQPGAYRPLQVTALDMDARPRLQARARARGAGGRAHAGEFGRAWPCDLAEAVELHGLMDLEVDPARAAA